MKMLRRWLVLTLLMPVLALTQHACAESGESTVVSSTAEVMTEHRDSKVVKVAPLKKYVEGEHYEVLLNPKKISGADKIEVMEIFWYGCSHCFAFESLLEAWRAGIAEDVVFARTPAIWRDVMRNHANVYYATQALDVPEEIHHDIFTLLAKSPAMVDQRKFAEIFARYGVSEKDYTRAFNAFGTMSKVSKAETRAKKNYQVQGTPEIVVNGKYRITGRMGGSQAGMLAVVDYLIDLERNAQ